MHFFLKKIRLLLFLMRRVPQRGWSQFMRGIRERDVGYLAMEFARILPREASTIVDVGAHTGLVSDALDFLYRPTRLWAVEPNPLHRAHLEARFEGRPNIETVRMCLGEDTGEVNFFSYEFDAASSLYACRPGHLASLGLSENNTPIKVPMMKLGDLLPRDLGTLDLLKVDCQGAELSVLKGAGSRIRQIRWIYSEVSFDPIYDNAPLFSELHSFLRAEGFELRQLGRFSGAGRSIQWADALYANIALASN